MKCSYIVILQEGADLDALSSALAYLKLNKDACLLKPKLLSRKSSRAFKEFMKLFRIVDELPEKFTAVLVDASHLPPWIEQRCVKEIIVYDHHPTLKSSSFKGRIEKTGSATTLLVEELMEKGINLTPEESTLISLGIYEDTGNLTFQGTTPRDLKALAWLLEKGADLRTIRKYLHEDYTKDQITAVESILSSIEKVYLGNLEVAIATAVLKEYQPDIISLLYEVKDLKEVDAYFVIIEAGRKTYVFGRSQCKEIDAGDLLSRIGGGGHPEAGSVKLENVSAQRVKTVIKRILMREGAEGYRVGDIMNTPPFFLTESTKVSSALRELSERGFATAPVVDSQGRVKGIISKKSLMKISKNFARSPIKEFVNSDITVLNPEDPLWTAEEILAKFGQKLIPVVKEGKLVGVITRLDIIQRMKEDLSQLRSARRKVKVGEPIETVARQVGQLAEEMGLKAYLVGGVVRDLIMGRSIYDVDFVVEGPAIELAREFAKRHGVECHPFEEFGTAHLKIDSLKVEFASTRRETYPSPGAYPIVEPSSLKEDLIRRDFTINAMAISVNPGSFGELIDYFGGFRDIKERLIRVIHPVSFIEDPVRILRALRFAARLDFNLSKNTSSLLTHAVEAGMLRKAPRGRVISEVRLALKEERIVELLHLYKKFGVLEEVIEGFQWKERIIQEIEELKKVVDWHFLEFPEERIDYGWLYLLFILSFVKQETARKFLNDISAPSWTRENLPHLYTLEGLIKKIVKASKPSQLYKLLKNFHTGILLLLMIKPEARERVKLFIENLRKIRVSRNEVDSLKAKGFEGKALGDEIERIKEEKMDRTFSL